MKSKLIAKMVLFCFISTCMATFLTGCDAEGISGIMGIVEQVSKWIEKGIEWGAAVIKTITTGKKAIKQIKEIWSGGTASDTAQVGETSPAQTPKPVRDPEAGDDEEPAQPAIVNSEDGSAQVSEGSNTSSTGSQYSAGNVSQLEHKFEAAIRNVDDKVDQLKAILQEVKDSEIHEELNSLINNLEILKDGLRSGKDANVTSSEDFALVEKQLERAEIFFAESVKKAQLLINAVKNVSEKAMSIANTVSTWMGNLFNAVTGNSASSNEAGLGSI